MTLALLGLLAASAWGATKVKLASEADHINYSIGYQMGTDFKNQGWELKPEAMVQGIQDAINGSEPLLSDDLRKATLAEMKRKLLHTQAQTAIDYQLASQKFMKENAGKEGVVVLPSGVQYKILREGTGKIPTLEDTVRIHFKLFKVDGTEVGSTYSNGDPRVVPLATAIPGLQEVIALMKEGAKYQIVLPMGMAASNREKDDSGAAIYEMELISIKPKI
jgi:FKBP-type peptidyl-prolyl cis-trans isomerase FklB